MTTTLYEKTLQLIDAEVEMEGAFSAVVASFGAEPDRQGDVIHRGAFTASLARWRASGQRIPVVWSHQTGDPSMVIGSADPVKSHETSEGLLLVGKLNVFDSPTAAHVRDLLKDAARSAGGRSASRSCAAARAEADSTCSNSISARPAQPSSRPIRPRGQYRSRTRSPTGASRACRATRNWKPGSSRAGGVETLAPPRIAATAPPELQLRRELMMSLSARVLARRAAVSALAPTMAKLGNTTRPSGARCVVGASGAAAGWRRVKVPGSAGRGFLPCYPSLFRARPRYARWPR
jgi:HK97 family phage prohead protease